MSTQTEHEVAVFEREDGSKYILVWIDAEDVDAFVQDARPDAYERLIDRLLGNAKYGLDTALDAEGIARGVVTEEQGPEFVRVVTHKGIPVAAGVVQEGEALALGKRQQP